MSKIICEICGTEYPDTAKECPICGFPHGKVDVDLDLNFDEVQLPEEPEAESAPAQKVRGGRFSNKNVKKRHEEDEAEEEPEDSGYPEYQDEPYDDGRKPGKGLKIAIAVLLVLVIAVGAYIGYRFLAGSDEYDKPGNPSVPVLPSDTQTEQQTETTQPTETGIPCTDMKISNETLEIRGAGRGWLMDVTVFPEDTTDEVTFVSSAPDVASVSENGRITAVGPGTATITITCGSITKECVVTCNFEGFEVTEPSETEETTEATEATEATKATEPAKPTEPVKTGFHLDRNDVTLFKKGESFRFGQSNNGAVVSSAQVVWTSSDPEIAKVDNGTVTAVGGGTCTITANYNGQVDKCIIRCNFKDEEAKPTEPTKPEASDSNWKISHSDVTIKVGETFSLKLTNDAGETATVSWSTSKDGVVGISGNSVTGKSAGMVNVFATIDGKTYTCIVRVSG